MLKYNGHILKVGSGTIKYTYVPPTYTVTCIATHGSVTATPSQGLSGTLITLSNTPDSGYEFDYYTVNGITLVGNTFTLTEDVTVECVFKVAVIDYASINGVKWAKDYYTAGADYTDGGIGYYKLATIRSLTPPSGWRLPTQEDMNSLCNYVGSSNGAKLVATSAGGTDDYGLSLLMSGYRAQRSSGTWRTYTGSSRLGFYFANLDAYFNIDSSFNMTVFTQDAGRLLNVPAYPLRLIKTNTSYPL